MVFNDEDKILIKSLYLNGYAAKCGGYDYEPASKQRDVTLSTRCDQPALSRATKCYHTTTGFFQSHPHFIAENKYAFICLNISNILLTDKCTQHTQLQLHA